MKITEKYIDLAGAVYFFDKCDKEPTTKENALIHYICKICKSWTFDRMTENEKERCINSLLLPAEQNAIKGSYTQRWQMLNMVYSAFLAGLGYSGPKWREGAARC